MLRNPHRIVVTLTDGGKKTVVCEGLRQIENDIKIMDDRTMMLRIENTAKKNASTTSRYYRHLEFDAVGYEYEAHVRAELCSVMEHLFKQKESCCIVRFAVERNPNLNLLTRLLVAEVDKFIMTLRCRLACIWLEYYDVRKFDMVNLLLGNVRNVKANKNRSSVKKINDVSHRRFLQSTRELFQWLLSDYAVLRARGIGDDYIDLQFVMLDAEQKEHKVHLSLFQIFGNPDDQRKDLMGFFKSLPDGSRCKPSLLTDCLKESFNMKAPMRSLLLFEVPLAKEYSAYLPKMLKLADAAYANVNLARTLIDAKNDGKAGSNSCKRSKLSKTSLSSTSNGSSLSTPPAENPKPSIRRAMKRISRHYSKDDFNSLSYWYNRIDKQINELTASMDKYYWVVYQNKMRKICDDIQNAGVESSGDMLQSDENKNKANYADEELQRQNYNDELLQFRRLDQEVEKSCYASTLKVYLSTKNHDLLQAEEALKRREMQNLRDNVMDFVKTEPISS